MRSVLRRDEIQIYFEIAFPPWFIERIRPPREGPRLFYENYFIRACVLHLLTRRGAGRVVVLSFA